MDAAGDLDPSLGGSDPLEDATSVFLSGEFHGQKSLLGYNPWGHKESDIIEATWNPRTTLR